ncbi:hypothetical protein S40293_09656, partial [Stachybotrys chartarum IBT 40293]
KRHKLASYKYALDRFIALISWSKLCTACAGITPQALIHPNGYTHLENALDLLTSAQQCDLCALIRRAMSQDTTEGRPDEDLRRIIAPEPVVMHGLRDVLDEPNDFEEAGTCSPMLFGVNVIIPDRDSGFDVAYLSLTAEPGSMAQLQQHVVGRSLFADAGSSEALRLVRGWYDTCCGNHDICQGTFSGQRSVITTPRLPTRVLDLGPPDGSHEPRLLITDGISAKYAALSHCWGKHRLLTTVTGNLAEHCKMMKLDALPKTFRDAIGIVRSLDIRYLWIDSLCIVQDDAEDWRRESVQMGRIYKDAAVTVAASGAADSSEGCFIARESPVPPVAIHYTQESSSGSFTDDNVMFATLFPDQAVSSLSQAPLGTRAWITQEWMLSPRTIHYTKARMAWACRTHVKCEDEYTEPPMDEQRLFDSVKRYCLAKVEPKSAAATMTEIRESFLADWCEMVSTYTCRNLTYESDKPVAIMGLATELGQSTGETYTAGLFHSKFGSQDEEEARLLSVQLFWLAKVTLTRPLSLKHLPSWSWTSTIGAVSFLPLSQATRLLIADLYLDMGNALGHNQSKSAELNICLRFKAKVKRWSNANSWPDGSPQAGRPGTTDYYSSILTTGGGINSQSMFLFQGPEKTPAGWVVFDLGVWPTQDVPLFMAAVSASDSNRELDAFNVLFLEETQAAVGKGVERCFVRLGAGEIIDKTWFDDVESQAVVLV